MRKMFWLSSTPQKYNNIDKWGLSSLILYTVTHNHGNKCVQSFTPHGNLPWLDFDARLCFMTLWPSHKLSLGLAPKNSISRNPPFRRVKGFLGKLDPRREENREKEKKIQTGFFPWSLKNSGGRGHGKNYETWHWLKKKPERKNHILQISINMNIMMFSRFSFWIQKVNCRRFLGHLKGTTSKLFIEHKGKWCSGGNALLISRYEIR